MTPSSAPRAAEAAADLAGPPTRAWTLRRRPSRTPTTRLSEDWRGPTRGHIGQGQVFGNKRAGAAAKLTLIRSNRGPPLVPGVPTLVIVQCPARPAGRPRHPK